MTTLHNLYFHMLFYVIQFCFLFRKNENYSNNKKEHFLLLFPSIMQITFLLQDNHMLLCLESLKE